MLNKTQKVLVFNASKKLLAICLSSTSAARLTHSLPQSVYKVCVGEMISHNGYYFRYMQEDKVSVDDIGKLSVKQYDKLCGSVRHYIKTKQ